jgi:hypothetical protein
VTTGIDPEEAAALAVLDSLGKLDTPEDTSVPEPEDEIDEVLRKLYADAVCMLAYALEPANPPAELRGALFSLTVGETTQEVEPPAAAEAPDSDPEATVFAAPATPSPAPAPEPAMAVGTRAPHERTAYAGRRAPSRRGRLAFAALFVVSLGGAGLWIAYLQSELAAQGSRLAWVEREWKGAAETAKSEQKELERRLALVTSPAVTVFHLRCPSGAGPGARANANVYVSADRKRWELEVQGLSSEPPGRDYQLWFVIGDEMRSGGCFSMADGEVAFLNPSVFPPGTTGILISLEPKGGSIRPTSPPILVSGEPVRL